MHCLPGPAHGLRHHDYGEPTILEHPQIVPTLTLIHDEFRGLKLNTIDLALLTELLDSVLGHSEVPFAEHSLIGES